MIMKVRQPLIFIFLLCFAKSSFAQNKILNSSFEMYSALPSNFGEWCLLDDWWNLSGTCELDPNYATPDFFHMNATGGVQLPNTQLSTIYPRTGNGIVGFAAWHPFYTDAREYISSTLDSPLVPGTTYNISFYYSNGESNISYGGYGCDGLGVYFSIDTVFNMGIGVLNVQPQLEVSNIVYSNFWSLITFEFTPTEPYRYMTIGVFKEHADLNTQLFESSMVWEMAYFYIEDVCLAEHATACAANLPVELVSFTAQEEDGFRVKLDWRTFSEVNFKYFEVEHSLDGFSWRNSIGQVAGRGNADFGEQYNLLHSTPSRGMNYYRLKMVDWDGSLQFSDVVSARIEMPVAYQPTIYPNPTFGDISIQMPYDREEKASLIVLDMTGKVVLDLGILPSDEYEITIPTANLPAGVYLLQHSFNGITSVQKIIKLTE